MRPHRARWRSIQSAASLSTLGSSERRWVRPITSRLTTPVSSRTFRCLVIAGLETPKPSVASPTVAGPAASRSTMPRRMGWERALNESLTTRLTISAGCRQGLGLVDEDSPLGNPAVADQDGEEELGLHGDSALPAAAALKSGEDHVVAGVGHEPVDLDLEVLPLLRPDAEGLEHSVVPVLL